MRFCGNWPGYADSKSSTQNALEDFLGAFSNIYVLKGWFLYEEKTYAEKFE